MKVTSPIDNCLLFAFKTRKELTLSFCRVQEFYESDKPALSGKHFSFYEFVNALMKNNGTIDYFAYWDGFNVPGDVYSEWLSGVDDLTAHEVKIQKAVKAKIKNQTPYYLIACLASDVATTRHEVAHAMYSMKTKAKGLGKSNTTYYNAAQKLNEEFKKNNEEEYDKMIKALKKEGYADKVVEDEIQAYLSTSTQDEIEEFKLNYTKLLPLIKKYRKLLNKYYHK